jgi:NAD(P)-dependent dehydrogenase (short-subunit alcohol dehydrogenase family)
MPRNARGASGTVAMAGGALFEGIDARMSAQVIVGPAALTEAQAVGPICRISQRSVVAGIIPWLVSDNASYVTGGNFAIVRAQTCL